MRLYLIVLSLMLLISTMCHAATLEETFAQAQTAYKNGNYAQAGALFTAAGDQLHKSGDASKAGLLWGNAAIAHIKGENWAEAADLYERILATNKRLPQDQALRIYKNLVLCRGKLSQRALQIVAIERMLKAIPKLPPAELADVYARQGDAYRSMELYGPAVAAYDKAVHLFPATAPAAQRAKIFTAMGLCQGNLGNYDKATQSLEQARKLAVSVNESLTIAESDSNLGILYWERGDYPKAMELIKKALDVEEKAKLRRSEGIDHNNLGLVYKAVGSHQDAMRQVEQSLAIAREVKNVRDEAIAIVNRALIYRIAGKLNEARADYREAMKLFEQCGFQEGTAGALLGIGRMEALADKNYALALENYQKALDIYTKLSLPRGRAETLLQLGEVYKYTSSPGRTTRDLVFDDEPTLPQIEPGKAIEQSRTYFTQAMEIAQQLQSKEMIWSANQGLGYADLREGKLEEALRHYMAAIDIVTSMYTSLESVELLGEYMAGKEDLYSEAQEVCAALYEKTKNKKYLDLQMKYAETLRNEVQKASAALVQMKFENKNKQAMYEKLNALGRQQVKAVRAIPLAMTLPMDATPEQKAEKALSDKAITEQKAVSQKLEDDYKKLLAEWEKKYPEDKMIFQSSSRVDTAMIQKNLEPGWIALHYIALHSKLLINVIQKDNVDCVSVDVSKNEIDNLIKNKFLVGYIENGYGRKTRFAQGEEHKDLIDVCNTLHSLYSYLVLPIKEYLEGKNRIYFISDGFLAQTPFASLVSSIENGVPNFLVEQFDIGYLRPSFIEAFNRPIRKGKIRKLLAIANPDNKNFWMPALPGTISEIATINSQLKVDKIEKDIAFDQRKITLDEIKKNFPDIAEQVSPTESWLTAKMKDNNYEIIYFATHGMPYSDTYITKQRTEEQQKTGTLKKNQEKFLKMVNNSLNQQSPFNGFLYLSSNHGDDITKGPIPEERDGLITIKEIRSYDGAFDNTRYIILSACNTGVSFVPKSLAENADETLYSNSNVDKELISSGLLPGVDQISFVDTFMSRGIHNVFGTLWFADDKITSELMSRFITNLVEQGNSPDAVGAFSSAQREIVTMGKRGEQVVEGYSMPQHPYLWAVGAIFGK